MDAPNIPATAPGDNSAAPLAELAERAGATYNRSLEAWLEVGDILLEARAIAAHGDWLPFLEHAGIPERTAQNMLRIARAGLQIRNVADLGGIRGALDYLAAVERARKNWLVAQDGSLEWCAVVGETEPSVDSPFCTGLWQVGLAEWADNARTDLPAAVLSYVKFVRSTPSLIRAAREEFGLDVES